MEEVKGFGGGEALENSGKKTKKTKKRVRDELPGGTAIPPQAISI